MATLVILRGLPASGKSTWARKAAATTPNTVIVSLDGLRRQITLAQKDTGEGVVIYGANGYMVKVKSDLYRQSKRLRPVLENILLRGKPVPQDDSERSRLVRAVLDEIPREQLVYHQSAFGRDAVDMTKITD